ncbi:MAG TPA: DUF4388 domain-containing protein [Candidatus Sulfotelmatobacter sp.]|nr:DUF4388 domain-containing protein [Candidatus Sulfotelmatobacter sp.]
MTQSNLNAPPSKPPRSPSRLRGASAAAAATALRAFLAPSPTSQAAILGPYTSDADTLHLWHLNEQTVPVIDLGPDGMHLTAMRNGATLGNVAAKGFGTALSTYDGGPEAITDAGRDAYLSARPLVNGSGDNAAMTYAGPSGAFTFEALVRVDFEPQTHFGTNAPGNGRGTFMQIINLDADESTNRICQFRLVPVGLFKTNTQPLLEFINLNKDKSPQSLTAPIPTVGPDAIALNGWYHAAVTYEGTPNRPDNLKFYWTLLDPNRSAANLIGSSQMVHDLPAGCAPDFALGQTGRQSPVTPYPNNNFIGLIDEVRLSGVARSATQMMFGGPAILASTPASKAPAATPRSTVAASAPRATSPVQAASTDHGSGLTWVIAAALLLITGLLGWLVLVLRRMATNGLRGAQSAASLAVQERLSGPGNGAATAPWDRMSASPEAAAKLSQDNSPGLSAALAEPAPAQAEVGFRGVLRKVGLQDVVQLECLNGKSSILEVANADVQGRIFIEKGEIVHAVANHLAGEEALYQLLALPGGEFSLRTFELPPARTVNGPWVELLMEAARVRDEVAGPAAAPAASAPRSLNSQPRPGPEGPLNSPSVPSSAGAGEALAMAALLQDHPQVKEILVCSSEGQPLHQSKCQNLTGRKEVCSALARTAKAVSERLPVGELKQLEIVDDQSRTIFMSEPDCNVLIGLARDGNQQPL